VTTGVAPSVSHSYETAVPGPYDNEGNLPLLQLLPAGIRTVLDVGCGVGSNARIMQARGIQVTALTLSEEEARLAAPFCVQVIVADVERERPPVFGSMFDLLLCSHVLEHLVRPSQTLSVLSTLLRPGGFALVAIPNIASWRPRVRLLRGNWSRDGS